jgi:hypothetical protein
VFIGANDTNNIDRAVPVGGNNVTASGYTRSIEPFMEGYLVEGLWRLTNYEGPSWSYYQKLRDQAYGVAVGIDQADFLTNISGIGSGYPSHSQLIYTMCLDQPNSLAWFTNDYNGPGPPSTGQVYAYLFNYLGSLAAYQSHWEANAVNSMANDTYQPNGTGGTTPYVYGTQTWDTAIYYRFNRPTLPLVTLCSGSWNQSGCSASYNSGTGQWTLSWAAPTTVSQYYLKENDSLTIVESIPWNEATNKPTAGNTAVATEYPWAAAGYTSLQPSAGSTSIVVTAPSTASFMLKAYATVSSSLSGPSGILSGKQAGVFSVQ